MPARTKRGKRKWHHLLRKSALILSVALTAMASSALCAEGGKYKIEKKLPLQGAGRWDYVTTDPEAHRVYIARATPVSVLDSETGAVVGDIPDTPGVHGVAVAPDLGIGFISEGGAAKVAVFDLKLSRWIPPSPPARTRTLFCITPPHTWFLFSAEKANRLLSSTRNQKSCGYHSVER